MISAIRAVKVPNYHRKAITVIAMTTTSIATKFNPILSPLRCTLQALINCMSPVTMKSTNPAPLQVRNWGTEVASWPSCRQDWCWPVPAPSPLPAPDTGELHTRSQLPSGLLSVPGYIFGFVSEFHDGAGNWKYYGVIYLWFEFCGWFPSCSLRAIGQEVSTTHRTSLMRLAGFEIFNSRWFSPVQVVPVCKEVSG